jgi:hypothetical protein
VIDPNRQVHTLPVVPFKNPSFPDPPAVVSFDGSGVFKPGVDTTVMLRDSDGGAGVVTYEDLQNAVRQKGGTATGQEVARALSRKGEEDSWMVLGSLPPGMAHPAVDYVFSLHGDQLSIRFQELKSAQLIAAEGGNVATVDLFGTGDVTPENGSLLRLHTHCRNGSAITTMVGLEALKAAVVQAGGTVGPEKQSEALRPLAPPGLDPAEIRHMELSENPPHISEYDGVKRTLRMDERGNLMIDYEQTS